MLKKLTATGIAAAGIAGVVLTAGPANAESLPVKHNACYSYASYSSILPAYCDPYLGLGYHYGFRHGWRHWHHYHPWNPYRYHR